MVPGDRSTLKTSQGRLEGRILVGVDPIQRLSHGAPVMGLQKSRERAGVELATRYAKLLGQSVCRFKEGVR